MKITKTLLSLILVFITSNSFAQQIDPSILSQLSPEQIEMAKDVYNSKNSSDDQAADIPVINESLIENTSIEDSNLLKGKKYGYNFFSSTPTSTSAVGDLPLPNEYKISLRDQITVILSGSKDAIYNLNVKLNGTILFPELGAIAVAGKTFGEVKETLSGLINQSYIGVQIDVSIKDLSAKKITIVGAVKAPGTYLVNPFSTISSALAYSGGISEIGTLRSIRLIRSDGNTFNFDLYKLLINGDRSDDITIEAGDVIVIDPAEQFITLTGEVRRPAIYEVTANETLEDLVTFGLGFSQYANKSNIELRILDIESSSIQNTNVTNLVADLANVLSVNINEYVNKSMASVKVSGAIKEPGFYSLSENKNLEDLIKNLEFIDVYPWMAVLEQFDDENLLKSSTLFNLNDPNTIRSIKLLPNSKIFFANINSRDFSVSDMTMSLINDYSLKLIHQQGSYELPVYGRFSVNSFLNLLGLDMSNVDTEATYISPLENIVVTDDYKNMQFTSQKFHTVSFRSPVNNLISVTISGAVDYPGTYTLQADSKIQDLYELIGNFKPEAFLDGIVFTRQSVRDQQLASIKKSKEDLSIALLTNTQKGEDIVDINIIKALSESITPENLGRIAGDFSPQSQSSMNTILLDGDSIRVNLNPNIINVLGEVLNPSAFEYSKKLNVRSAIINAGGYQDYADKRKVYVIKANGIVKKVNRNIFAGNITLEPGDSIIVPRKIINNSPRIQALIPITNLLSNLAFSAAALDNLSTN
jgi:polysaccharide export outer membrane protein